MKQYVFFGLLAVLILGGAFFIFSDEKTSPVETLREKPWVKVVAPEVYTLSLDGKKTELHSGDILSEGVSLISEGKGQADIYFPNGSVARLDQGSSITLEQTSFNNESSSVKILLLRGRLWSKIFSKENAGNEWEVRTGNAVATVRGTAFGMQFEEGKSTVFGSENKVLVRPLQADGTPREDKNIVVTENTFVRIDSSASATSSVLKTESINKDLQEYQWIGGNESADQELRKEFEEGAKTGGEDGGLDAVKSFSRSLWEEENKAREDASQTKDTKNLIEGEPSRETPLGEKEILLPTRESVQEKTPTSTAVPLSLSVSGGEKVLQEGGKTSYRAVLRFSDGTEKDVTKIVEWKVVGPIGRITEGVFEASLDSSVSEQGKGVGAIVAVFTIEGGKILSAQTSIFTVEANILKIPLDIGGQ